MSNSPPATGYATLDLRSGFAVLDMDDAADEKAIFHAVLPSHYGGGQVLAVVTWTSTSGITGNAKLRIEATRIQAGTNLDSLPAAAGSSDVVVAAPTASGELVVSQTSAIDVGGASSGDTLLITLTRLATDAADTLAGDVELLALEVREV
ncbi:MAG: hypothetical protein MI725_04945 [Pirellulales bacterium]|nr:hypothetical protein [Pirellulales bacterium]